MTMPLPNLEKIVPQFELIIPSTRKPVTFRPFLVKEEKILLMALESEDRNTMLDAMVSMISACAISHLKVEDLANFDIEYIFLQLRAQSVDGTVELNYRCRNDVDMTPEEIERAFTARNRPVPESIPSVKCNNVVKVKINLNEVQVQFPEGHSKQIFFTDTLGVNMRYPNFKMAKTLLRQTALDESVTDTVSETLTSIALCIESVFDEESVYTNFSPSEMVAWIEQLTQAHFVKLQEIFFETIPKLEHIVQFKCNKCGFSEPQKLEGLESFFV